VSRAVVVAAAVLLAACSAGAPTTEAYQVSHDHELPTCSGDLGLLVTCCDIDEPGPHPKVCGPCVEGDRGPDCTNAPPLCVCPSDQRCLTGPSGGGVACANVFIPPKRD
jgi:hypothetical protein